MGMGGVRFMVEKKKIRKSFVTLPDEKNMFVIPRVCDMYVHLALNLLLKCREIKSSPNPSLHCAVRGKIHR